MKHLLTVTLLTAFVVLISACTVPARQGSGAHADRVSGSNAVVDLVDKAKRLSSQGNHSAAAATLERALRIESRNPAVWYNLAVVQYRQGKYVQAENTAKRSLSYVSKGSRLYHSNWTLIAQSRQQRGDRAGAVQANQKAAE